MSENQKPRKMDKGKQSQRPYPLLCEAVVERACKDYRQALRVRQNQTRTYGAGSRDTSYRDMDAEYTIVECEYFFRHDLDLYSDLDGEYLIKQIRNMVKGDKRC